MSEGVRIFKRAWHLDFRGKILGSWVERLGAGCGTKWGVQVKGAISS